MTKIEYSISVVKYHAYALQSIQYFNVIKVYILVGTKCIVTHFIMLCDARVSSKVKKKMLPTFHIYNIINKHKLIM